MPSTARGGMMAHPTKQDLKDLSADIEKHINLLIAPILADQADMKTILIGASKRNGLVGDQKVMKEQFKNVSNMLYFLTTVVVGTAVKLVFFS